MQVAEVEAFVAIAASNSLSGAARRLGVLPMTISRRLASLEEELAVRLVHRTTRSVSLTPEGELYLPYAQAMLDANEAARAAILSCAGAASGLLKVTAPTVFGQAVILPMIPELLEENPALRIDLTLSDSIVDIVGLGIDVAIRIATLRDSALVARHLAPNPRVICASPSYLQRKGIPGTLEELRAHDCIGLHSMPYWPLMKDGERCSVKADAAFSANSVEAVRRAGKVGLGIVMLSYWDVRTDLADGSLQEIKLADAVPENLSITALLPTRQQVPYRVKAFLDKLSLVLATPE
ncbi:LysR family transcriptional regulator [Pseudomonas ceruminis]|uniref:LysR family transcriptional regulator n=1 Tax=Pseudomonas TaxID=286 RepID=UPI001296E152|nr:LysR family transcriptional regulator [Pseudomonas sp. FSL R10-0399]MQT59827.1 LysR family transcriptional regulator [Pseudomonas sp. FSL R10-0399]